MHKWVRRILAGVAWTVVIGLVTGVIVWATAAKSASVAARDITVALDQTEVVLPNAQPVRITAVVDETDAKNIAFFTISAFRKTGTGPSIDVPTSGWESESTATGRIWSALIEPTAAMNGAQLGVHVSYGFGSNHHEVTQFGPSLVVRSRVDILATGPFLIDAANRAPLMGLISCYPKSGGSPVPFGTPFALLYEQGYKTDVWKPFPGKNVSDDSGRFMVSLNAIPLDRLTKIRLKINVPGFGYEHASCGWTDAQANVYEFDIKQPKQVPPSVPSTLQIAPGKRAATLRWSSPESDGYAAVTGYQVRRGRAIASLSATTHSYAFTDLPLVSRVTVAVRAHNVKGWSAWAPVTFSTVAPPPRTYATCTQLQRDYPGGVGIPGVKNQHYYPSAKVYKMQPKRLDSDRDKIACERR